MAAQLGPGALVEARYRLSLAEERFRASLARTARELDSIDYWVSINKLLTEDASDQESGLTDVGPR